MKLTTRELVTIAVFGALWGVVEISLGSMLKALHLPFNGALLGTVGLTIALIGRLFVPRRGATLFMGVIATLMKLFSIGGVVVGPMIGILSEAVLAEVVLSLLGAPSLGAFLLAGALGVCWTLVQPFVTGALLFGRGTMEVWLDAVRDASQLLGLPGDAVLWIALVLIGLHVALGFLGGWLAWETGKHLNTRLSERGALQN